MYVMYLSLSARVAVEFLLPPGCPFGPGILGLSSARYLLRVAVIGFFAPGQTAHCCGDIVFLLRAEIFPQGWVKLPRPARWERRFDDVSWLLRT